jgi:hypothetical protein
MDKKIMIKIMQFMVWVIALGVLLGSGIVAYKNSSQQSTDAPNLIPVTIIFPLASDVSVINYENKKYVVKTIQVNNVTCLFIIYPNGQVSIQPLK